MEKRYNKPSMEFYGFVVEDIITGSNTDSGYIETKPPVNPGVQDSGLFGDE